MEKEIVEIPEAVREKEIQRVCKLIMEDFEMKRKEQEISKSDIAIIIGKDPAVITRSAKLENKPELETVIQLYMGINRRIIKVVTEEYDFKIEK